VPETWRDWFVDLKGFMGQVPGEFYKGRSSIKEEVKKKISPEAGIFLTSQPI